MLAPPTVCALVRAAVRMEDVEREVCHAGGDAEAAAAVVGLQPARVTHPLPARRPRLLLFLAVCSWRRCVIRRPSLAALNVCF